MDQSIKEKIEDVLNLIRLHLLADGGDMELVEITDDYIVKVKLKGACGCCPHALMTLKYGVEAAVKEHVPEVQAVEAVNIHII